MAGSRKWFVYTDDAEEEYAINLDESNTEAVNGTTGEYPDTDGPTASVPTNIQVREIFYANPTRTRTIRCVALTPGIYTGVVDGTNTQTITDPIAGTGTLGLIRANGERRRIPTPVDTGQTDGDD